jgi:hypothetical protein
MCRRTVMVRWEMIDDDSVWTKRKVSWRSGTKGQRVSPSRRGRLVSSMIAWQVTCFCVDVNSYYNNDDTVYAQNVSLDSVSRIQ